MVMTLLHLNEMNAHILALPMNLQSGLLLYREDDSVQPRVVAIYSKHKREVVLNTEGHAIWNSTLPIYTFQDRLCLESAVMEIIGREGIVSIRGCDGHFGVSYWDTKEDCDLVM